MSPADDIRLVDVWRREDAKVSADAIALWEKLEALPRGTTPEARAKELCTVAYHGDELVAVSTMVLDILPQLKARFGFFRCLVAPDQRRHGLAYRLGVHCRDLLAEWSLRHPEEKVLGMAAIIESPALDEFSRTPVWHGPEVKGVGLALIGYTAAGRQIRVSWFDHARLD